MAFRTVSIVFLYITSTIGSNQSGGKTKPTDGVNSFLWRIDADPPSYMFGTVNLPYLLVWDSVPANAKAAFEQSSHVYSELSTIDDLISCKLLPDGQGVSQVLPEGLYNKLYSFMDFMEQTFDASGNADEFQIYFGNWNRTRPVWIATDLILRLARSFHPMTHVPEVVHASNLDYYLYEEAVRKGKPFDSLETAEEKCEAREGIVGTHVLDTLDKVLEHIEKHRLNNQRPQKEHERVLDNYKKGVNVGMGGSGLLQYAPLPYSKTVLDLEAEYLEKVVYGRSRRMGESIVRHMSGIKKGDSYFFAVSVGHFAGKDRIQDVVEAAGFKVDHVDPKDLEFLSRWPQDEL